MGNKPSSPDASGKSESQSVAIPGDITEEAAVYAGDHSLFRTANENSREASRVSHLGPHLLRHLVNGRQDVVIAMLTRYPDLAYYQGDVTDSSGIQYKHINALELALKLPGQVEFAFEIYKILCESEKYKQDDAAKEDFAKILSSKLRDHVAIGNQDAAEAMLKEHPEFLKFQGPVTDYSGRTFHCTAYEYAYWAKDTHMCRMLEKYMDGAVRDETLRRLECLECDGLTYRQRGQQHCSSHFDLTPLKDALKHFLDEYKRIPERNKSEADWDALGKIWIEEVGRAQRDVPAHIAQEYCDPGRSFLDIADITKSKALLDASNPANLKRSLEFDNWEEKDNDWWFYPGCYAVDSGLGFSFGILRWGGARPSSVAGMGPLVFKCSSLDLAAVKAIDEERTQDLKQSLKNLSQPGAIQSSQSHGI